MINHIIIVFFTIFIYELIKFTNLVKIIKSNLKIYKKFLVLFKFKKVSDFRKGKLILYYSKSLLISSFQILLIIIIVSIFILILSSISSFFSEFILSFSGVVEITIFFFIYHKFREIINAKL